MTKQEAIELESKCDELMSEYIKEECNVSMALTGKLKIIFDDNYIVFDKALRAVHYINYTGDYQDLMDIIRQAFFCIYDHKSMFDRLIWSYEHMRELE
jgi:hypothetical protein